MCGDMLQLLRPLDRQEAVAGSSCHILPQLGHSQAFLADVEPLQHACTARCNTQSPVKGFRGVGTGQQCLAYHETLAARLYGQEAHLAAGNWHNWHQLDCGASAGRLYAWRAAKQARRRDAQLKSPLDWASVTSLTGHSQP